MDWAHPLAAGLQGGYLLNEGGGTTIFDLAGKVNGSFTNAMRWAVGELSGAPVVRNPGTLNVNVTFGNNFSFLSGLTVATRIQWLSAGPGTSVVASKNGSSTQEWQFRLASTIDISALEINVFDQAAFTQIGRRDSSILSTGVWYSIAATWDGTTTSAGLRIYRDGQRVDNLDNNNGVFNSVQAAGAAAMLLNEETDGTNASDAFMDYAYLWNRGLSAAEVAWLYSEPFAFVWQVAPKRHFFGPAAAAAVATTPFQAAWARPQPIIGTGVF